MGRHVLQMLPTSIKWMRHRESMALHLQAGTHHLAQFCQLYQAKGMTIAVEVPGCGQARKGEGAGKAPGSVQTSPEQ